ncbi:MAG TPA: sugar-transfer associated ATP-grasp domain-containing protein [Patescibacteria group bacterium]|nr:sugar-transfer associated ATP-grasp domain-containing protein [Patescibacteria group bacterium]
MAKFKNLLGMNSRNLLFIAPSNPRRLKRLVDNKLLTKQILKRAHLSAPKIYQVFESKKDLDNFDWKSLPNSFVIKPARGFGGEGILVVFGKKKHGWSKQDSSEINISDIKMHILDILDGNFSMNNAPDTAFIEQKVKTHRFFKRISFRGTPDIRVIVYNKIPVMAMLRLPTRDSGGRANIHQGAVAVGVEIASGITTRAWWKNRTIRYFPGTKRKLNGLKIPEWEQILYLASEAQQAVGLGYLGVDIVLDREDGPQILELNARPGLAIQLANLSPLKRRLERVEDLKIKDTEKAIRVAKELFGGEIIREIQDASGKRVLGMLEPVKIITKKQHLDVVAKTDTGAFRTSIDQKIAAELSLDKKVIGSKKVHSSHGHQVRPLINLIFIISGKKIKTAATIANRGDLRRDMIIGRRDLKNFIIDPAKKTTLKQVYKKE